MGFVIHWHESAMDLHVLPILIPPPTSLSTSSLWVFPVHQAWALVSCIQPGLVICFTLDNSILAWKIPWTSEPGRLQAMGTQRVRCDWATEHSKRPIESGLYRDQEMSTSYFPHTPLALIVQAFFLSFMWPQYFISLRAFTHPTPVLLWLCPFKSEF